MLLRRPLIRSASTVATRRVLVTGATGQIGLELVSLLKSRLNGRTGTGEPLVLATDLHATVPPGLAATPYTRLDVTDAGAVRALVKEHRVDTIVHLASLLSVTGEQNPALAMRVNRGGAEAVLEAAAEFKCKVFAPSTIAAFGPSTPRDATPDLTIMRPTTIYGVTKVYLELLGDYYNKKFGVDFRSVRYPGVISWKALPGGGTTDYAVNIFYDAIKTGKYECFLGPDSALPMMCVLLCARGSGDSGVARCGRGGAALLHPPPSNPFFSLTTPLPHFRYMPDALEAAVRLIDAPAEKLRHRTYNVTGVSFTPKELGAALSAEMVRAGRAPLQLSYKPDFRQAIADSWPRSLDDSHAREDWGWKHQFDCASMTRDMYTNLVKKLQ